MPLPYTQRLAWAAFPAIVMMLGTSACGPIESDPELPSDNVCCVDPDDQTHIPPCPDDPTPPVCADPADADLPEDYGPDPLPW